MENFINGKWTKPQSGNYGNVVNPVTAELIEKVPHSNLEDVDAVMQSSFEAFKKWKKVPVAERAKIQHKAAQSMREQAEELGNTLAKELGRPLEACINEIKRSADLTDYYAEEGLRLKGEIPLHNIEGERAMVIREPIGVVVAITSFNYPIALLTMKLGAALITGCTVVSKPSDDTPLSTMLLAELFSQAGYPDGVFNVITGRGRDIGDALVTHKYTAKIAFTGGTSTGQRIGALAAQYCKRVTLELGGQSPVIVCEDANLDLAIPAIVKHTFANSGQFCYRVSRIYVHEAIYRDFVTKMTEQANKLTVGDQFSGSDMGPIISEKIYKTSEEQTADAKKKGATVTTGGERLKGEEYDKGWFFPPTIIADVDHSMEIMKEETFGPVAAIMKFKNNAEAIELANDSVFGLAAYVFTGELGTGLRIAEELEAGSVWVNNIQRSYHDVPFGGVKQSGIGREKGRQGIESFTELKTIYYSY